MPRVLWSDSAGKRGWADRPSSVVRVFERADTPGRIYLTRSWIRGRGRTKALKHGTTRRAATSLAKKTAAMREELILRGRDAFGESKEVTLFDLLDRYHGHPRARRWSDRHRASQERYRRFWKRTLGDVLVAEETLTPDLVESEAADAAVNSGWSARTEEAYLKYLKAATRWGKRKGRLYGVDPLEGLDLPEVRYDTRKRVYDLEEARRLSTPDPRVDWRVTLAFSIAVSLGRRISSILALTEQDVADVEIGGRTRMLLHFRAEFDKGGRDEWVPVPYRVTELVRTALGQPEVEATGMLFPCGRLGFADERPRPIDAGSAIKKLHEAERILGIDTVPGKGFHAAKRLHVTLGGQVAGGDFSLVGDVTGNVSEHVLRSIYRQTDLGQMATQVDGVETVLQGSNVDNNVDSGAESDSTDSKSR